MKVRAKADEAIPLVELRNGVKMPALGLGTFPMGDSEAKSSIESAHQVGYSLFDTSPAYGNERGVGSALSRKDFVTTKISNRAQREGHIIEEFMKSLLKLRKTRVDLLLLHWPYPGKYVESWKALEKLYRRGLCQAIGVANFHGHHLRELMNAAEVAPMVNQIELHPMLSQKSLVDFCRSQGIVVEAYSPFARMDGRLFENEALSRISEKYGKTKPQIILRWNYQNGIVSIPKTSSSLRMRENASIFDFSLLASDMLAIDSIDSNTRVRHDPDNCDFDKL